MKTFSIKEAIKTNWLTVKANFWFVVGTTFVYSLFNTGQDFGLDDGEWNFGWEVTVAIVLLMIILGVVGVVVQIGYTTIYLKLHQGVRAEFKELFTNYKPFWRYVGSAILYTLRVFVGFLLLIVPGFIWAIKFQFMPLLILDRGMRPVEAMRESGRMTDGHKWHLFKFMLVMGAINIVGLICLVVGLLVTIPLTTLAFIHVYRKLS